MPYFTIFRVLFIIVFTICARRNTAQQEKVMEEFWNKELRANNVRKQDISQMHYIKLPVEELLAHINHPLEDALRALSEEPILNLTGISNTDLKLQYGVANLETLSQYDTNFATLVTTLADYSKLLLEKDMVEDAKKVLKYGVSIDADSIYIYTTLASLYEETGDTDSIMELISSAEHLKSISKASILEKLERYNLA